MQQQQRWFAYRRYAVSVVLISSLAIDKKRNDISPLSCPYYRQEGGVFMSGKRVLALYGALIFGFAVVVCRLFRVCSDPVYAARAAAQSTVTLTLPARRGNFYDHRGQLLTGQTTRWMALCVPGGGQLCPPVRLHRCRRSGGNYLPEARNAASPFLLEVDRDVSALGVSCWPTARRTLPPRWQCSCWGTSMARAMVLPVWKPPLTNCSPAAGGGYPALHRQRPGKAAGRAYPSPPPTAGPWGCS